MINPNIISATQNEITTDNSNGNAYWKFQPQQPRLLTEQVNGMAEYGDFTELSDVVRMAAENGSVLVHGAPGSGKSHLVRELQTSAVIHNVPTFCLTTHINAGKRTGIDNIQEPLGQFRHSLGETGQGLIILDNVDFLGYRGSSRRPNATAEYASRASTLFKELIHDPQLAVVGTAHDQTWRTGRWTWGDDRIDVPARETLDAFSSHLVFEGRMSLVGLAHILHGRGGSLGDSARVIRSLHEHGKARFFYANHLNVKRYLEDPTAAVAEIEAGRQERSRQA